MHDCLIVGGGVIGLSLAYELARHGLRVRVIDARAPGQEASWKGAGMLPASSAKPRTPQEQLAALSSRLHVEWSEALRAETGIDNGLRRSGALYLARSESAAERLTRDAESWRSAGIAAERIEPAELGKLEPALVPSPPALAAWRLPDESQLRNPRHLRALIAACQQRGVEITSEAPAERLAVQGERVVAVHTRAGSFSAENVCIASGAWSGELLAQLGIDALVRPVRGQIALLATPQPILAHIIAEGPRYLVPRDDGRVLVGSTEEDAGFNQNTTAEGVAGLLDFAQQLVPALGEAQVERCWAGLRPGSADGEPYLGRAPGLTNLFVAAGHYRGGLHLSTGTAVVVGRLVRGLEPGIDLAPFRVDRGTEAEGGRRKADD